MGQLALLVCNECLKPNCNIKIVAVFSINDSPKVTHVISLVFVCYVVLFRPGH